MKRLLPLFLIFMVTSAQVKWEKFMCCNTPAAGGCAQATAWLARVTVDATHQTAYTNFICGGVTDGWWAKMDVVQIYATDTSANALLNVVGNYSNGTLTGTTFTANTGFTGVNASVADFIDTNFNPTSNSSTACSGVPCFTQNSAHVGVYSATNIGSGGPAAGVFQTGVSETDLFPEFLDGNSYFRINDGTASGGTANADSSGFYVETRSGVSASLGYRNGSLFATLNQTSGSLVNGNIYGLTFNNVGVGANGGWAGTLELLTIGSNLSATDISNLNTRFATYRTAVGAP